MRAPNVLEGVSAVAPGTRHMYVCVCLCMHDYVCLCIPCRCMHMYVYVSGTPKHTTQNSNIGSRTLRHAHAQVRCHGRLPHTMCKRRSKHTLKGDVVVSSPFVDMCFSRSFFICFFRYTCLAIDFGVCRGPRPLINKLAKTVCAFQRSAVS